ncbi:hypothetical protein SK128_016345, partial [Halocaridina rubra]
AFTAMITAETSVGKIVTIDPPNEYEKSSDGMPRLRMIYNMDPSIPFNSTVFLKGDEVSYNFPILETEQGHISGTEFLDVEPGKYEVYLPFSLDEHYEKSIGEFSVRLGGVYNFLVHRALNSSSSKDVTLNLYKITSENSVHMLWLVPQYFVITVSEVMFSITGLEFSFTQAPASMKSVLQAAWLLTVAFGNLIVVVIAEAKFFSRQALEFFLFAALMFVDMIIFAILASRYKYIGDQEEDCTAGIDITPTKPGRDNEGFADDETKF